MENGTPIYDGNGGLVASRFDPEQKQTLPSPEDLRAYEAERAEHPEWFDMIDELSAEMRRLLKTG